MGKGDTDTEKKVPLLQEPRQTLMDGTGGRAGSSPSETPNTEKEEVGTRGGEGDLPGCSSLVSMLYIRASGVDCKGRGGRASSQKATTWGEDRE